MTLILVMKDGNIIKSENHETLLKQNVFMLVFIIVNLKI